MLALAIGTLASIGSDPTPIDQKLISIQAQEALPGFDRLQSEPVELQAALIDLGNDPLLLLKAQSAMLVYPEMARTILPLYASEPEFREVLKSYGEHALPPIDYFLRHPVSSVEWMNKASIQYQRTLDYIAELRGLPVEKSSDQLTSGPLTPEERGWYAVNFVAREGSDFIGQFVVGPEGETQWVQTERVTEGLTQFFTGGIRQLERSYRRDGDVTAAEFGWASVDVLVFASAVKVLRAGRAVAKTTQGARLSTRSAALAARVTASGRLLLKSARYAKWPAIIGVGYLVVSHPSLISDFLASAAEMFGLPTLAVQIAGWFLLLVPAIYVASWLLVPLIGLLRGATALLIWMTGQRRRAVL
jgi:hypothetical protein